MSVSIRRATAEKELRMAGAMVGTKEALEAKGMIYMGSVSMAAHLGYLTLRACEKCGRPVAAEEQSVATHFAMLASCDIDLCLIDASNQRRRPCIPVFLRSEEAGMFSS